MPKILYVQYNNPAAFPPLLHSSRLFALSGWRILFLGIGAMGGADRLRLPPCAGVEFRRMPFRPPGVRQKIHYFQYTLWVMAWALRWRPVWIYASDHMSCPSALLISWLLGIKTIYHEHDSPDAKAPSNLFMRLCLTARRWLARRSALCILPNEERAARFKQEMPEANVICVWNCPSRNEVAPPRPQRHKQEDLWVLYHGSIVPPRLPEAVIKALKILPEQVKLRVIGYETLGYKGYVEHLRETARRFGVENRVEFLGEFSRHELFEWCRRSDVGLSFMPMESGDVNLRHMVGASNKAFDYLACGLALLTSDLPEWHETFVQPGYALACDPEEAESIASALQRLLDDPKCMSEMGEGGRQKIAADWNYETQFAKVMECIGELHHARL
ncbi:MAG: glycosyltransferase [Pyrinomonadaceae bacterium]|nr:glycosyltransferase [Pyrinomonadaceae bacterium]